VPDQTIWAGSSRFLLLHWNDQPGVVMTLVTTSRPSGRLTLEAFDSTDWLLTYVPAPEDKIPFMVTVMAAAGGQQQTQSWQISPNRFCRPRPTTSEPACIHSHLRCVRMKSASSIDRIRCPAI
jgi:hypothetical protein